MTKKVLLVALLVVVIAVGGVAALASAAGQAAGQAAYLHRLFGVGKDGLEEPPTGDFLANFLELKVSNPDRQYSKTLQKIVITNALSGAVVKEIPLSGQDALLAPGEVFARDFRQLNIDFMVQDRYYNVEVYWEGRGEALLGWVMQGLLLGALDQNGNPYLKEILGAIQSEMKDYLVVRG